MSLTASGVILRGKYQHFDLYLFYKNYDLTILCKKGYKKIEEILILRGQNALGKQKIQFLLQSSSTVNINTVWKLNNF